MADPQAPGQAAGQRTSDSAESRGNATAAADAGQDGNAAISATASPTRCTATVFVPAKESAAESFDLAKLIEVAFWPALIVVLLIWFRRPVARMVDAIAVRAEKGELALSIGDLSIKLGALESKIESVAASEAETRQLATVTAAGTGRSLDDLADEYEKIEEPDRARRTEKKEALAIMMGATVIQSSLSRDELANSPSEVKRLALAVAVHMKPGRDDVPRILRAGQNITRRHVRYRILMAIARLADKRYLRKADAAQAVELAETYQEDADAALRRRIHATLAVLQAEKLVRREP